MECVCAWCVCRLCSAIRSEWDKNGRMIEQHQRRYGNQAKGEKKKEITRTKQQQHHCTATKQNMASKECSSIISYRVFSLFFYCFCCSSTFPQRARALRSLISWLIKRHYEIQYFNVVCANGKITIIYIFSSCASAMQKLRVGGGHTAKLHFSLLRRFYFCFHILMNTRRARNEWAGKCAQGKDKYRLYLFF